MLIIFCSNAIKVHLNYSVVSKACHRLHSLASHESRAHLDIRGGRGKLRFEQCELDLSGTANSTEYPAGSSSPVAGKPLTGIGITVDRIIRGGTI